MRNIIIGLRSLQATRQLRDIAKRAGNRPQAAGMAIGKSFIAKNVLLHLKSRMLFKALGLSDEIVQGVQSMGYIDPTPIQLRAVPIVLGGRDLIGSAQTGTGKTAAFALPILTNLAKHGTFRCLVLEPT